MFPQTETLTERTERVLQEAILSGALKPGGRLTIPMLSEQFGFGATPLREIATPAEARAMLDLKGADKVGF